MGLTNRQRHLKKARAARFRDRLGSNHDVPNANSNSQVAKDTMDVELEQDPQLEEKDTGKIDNINILGELEDLCESDSNDSDIEIQADQTDSKLVQIIACSLFIRY